MKLYLVKKQYVERRRSEKDRRVVFVKLTEKGIAAYRHHEDYHRRMTQAVLERLDEEGLPGAGEDARCTERLL